MPTPDDAFLEAIHADPGDDTHRLVYADWLEEQGQAARGRLIRVACELARPDVAEGRRAVLREREQALWQEVQEGWLGPLAAAVREWQLDRGLIVGATLSVPAFLEHGEDLCGRVGARRLHLTGTTGELGERLDVPALAAHPALARVRTLDLQNTYLFADVRTLASSPYLTGLEELRLEGNAIGEEGALALAESTSLGRLTRLSLGGNLLGDAGVEALTGTWGLPRLSILDLSRNSITDEGLAALAASFLLGRLTVLDLSGNLLSDRGILDLTRSPHLGGLRALDLSNNYLGDAAVQALARCSLLEGLQGLDLHGNPIGSGGYHAWAVSPFIQRLIPWPG